MRVQIPGEFVVAPARVRVDVSAGDSREYK